MTRKTMEAGLFIKALSTLGAVTRQRLAWAVEDRLAMRPGASIKLRLAARLAVEELVQTGMTSNHAVACVRALILSFGGVSVAEPGVVEGEEFVARAS